MHGGEFACEEHPASPARRRKAPLEKGRAFLSRRRGDPQPDSSAMYRQTWFVYLKSKRPE
jgi:hypothetical protein